MSRDTLITLAVIVIALLALDDITTDTDQSFLLEWSALAACGIWFVVVARRFWRRRTVPGIVTRTPVWKFVWGLVVLIAGAGVGIPLARYAERDDAPGGVVIAVLIMVGAAVIAIRIVKQRPESRARK